MLVLTLLVGCTNSGLGDDAITGTADTSIEAVEDCPWVGTWDLTGVNCATFPFDDWYNDYTSASMTIGQSDDTGCDVAVTVTGAECEETEDWHFSPPVGVNVDVSYNGISACNPDACTFGGPDQPCSVGDRAGGAATISIDDATGDLQVVGALAETAAGCTLDVITTWAQ